MADAPLPPDEQDRIAALHGLGILDTEREERFDRITRVAAALFDVPIALVSLVDVNRQWFKSCIGLPVPETPRGMSFCAHAILAPATMVIEDARADPRFADNPLVTGEPNIRFYAGRPLRTADGAALGTLCIIDSRVRTLDERQLALLDDVGAWAANELASVELAGSERRLQSVMDSVADAIVTFDRDGLVTGANRAAAVNLREESLVGRRVDELLSGVGWDTMAPAIEGALGRRQRLTARRRDGTTFPLELTVTRLDSEKGDEFIITGRDIADRVAAERRLQESEAQFRTIFDEAPVGIALVGLDGAVVAANREMARMAGRTPAELIGMRLGEAAAHEDVGAADAQLRALMEGRIEHAAFERRYTRPSGAIWWGALRAALLRDASGAPHRLLCMVEDVTERRDLDRVKDEFVSVVGHELRTPLTSIRGSLGLVAGGMFGTLDDEGMDLLRIASENTDRLVRLINDILDVERLRAGRAELERAPVPARRIAEDAAQLVRNVGVEGVQVLVDADEAEVLVDADRMVQAITNLLGNAVKFSPPGGTVSLTVRGEPDYVRFEVRDQGRGIPADRLETIFERFRQVDASDARDKGGTGLGLAITEAIVQQHGGRVWAANLETGGALFTIELPVGAHGGRTVLIVEDDAGLARVLASALSALDAEPVVVGDAEEALDRLAAVRPAAVVLDVALPGANGGAVVRRLNEEGLAGTPIVVYTGLDLGPRERGPLQLGATRFFAKAHDTPETVAACVADMLETRVAP